MPGWSSGSAAPDPVDGCLRASVSAFAIAIQDRPSGDCRQQIAEQASQIAHRTILATSRIPRNAQESGIRHAQARRSRWDAVTRRKWQADRSTCCPGASHLRRLPVARTSRGSCLTERDEPECRGWFRRCARRQCIIAHSHRDLRRISRRASSAPAAVVKIVTLGGSGI